MNFTRKRRSLSVQGSAFGGMWRPPRRRVLALLSGPIRTVVPRQRAAGATGRRRFNPCRFAFLAVLSVTALLGSACYLRTYANEVTGEVNSPSGRWKAVAFVRVCTVGVEHCPGLNYVSVLNASERLPDAEGNVMSLDGGSRLQLDISGKIRLDLEWKRDDLLVVSYPGPARVLGKRSEVGPVHIEYRPIGFL